MFHTESRQIRFIYICYMYEIKQITSVQNPLVKKIRSLQEKSRERKKTGLFALEGVRELQLALKAKYTIETILFQGDFISEDELKDFLNPQGTLPAFVHVSKEVYQKMAYRESTEGVIAIAKAISHTLSDLQLPKKNALILVAEAPEKPGNIGALLRTADAANLDAVIIANPRTDLYNPNIVRSSVGGLFTNQLAVGTTEEVIQFLKSNGVRLYCAALSASIPYVDVNFKEASAIIVGTEATGLSDRWLRNSNQNILIPMQGEIDSMNVSVSAAILIFEAKRQRGF